MAHHKRKRPKNQRSGCRLCKPHKANGAKGKLDYQTWQERKARISEKEQIDGILPRRINQNEDEKTENQKAA